MYPVRVRNLPGENVRYTAKGKLPKIGDPRLGVSGLGRIRLARNSDGEGQTEAGDRTYDRP